VFEQLIFFTMSFTEPRAPNRETLASYNAASQLKFDLAGWY